MLTSRPIQKNESIEITIIDPTAPKEVVPNNAKQIVEQEDKQINDEIDANAKFLSRFNQKVTEETKARKSGAFRNATGEGVAKKTQTQKAPQEVHPEVAKKTVPAQEIDHKGGLPTLSQLKPRFEWEKVEVGVANPGVESQSDDHLKEVKEGPQTLLSSREFVYYSYYARIKDRLRMFWEPKIKDKIRKIFMSGRHIASESRTTSLVITLDRGGKLVRVQVLGESGLKDLDDAAIEAFQAAAPFPNPPQGIIESDGTIKIRWDFVLEA